MSDTIHLELFSPTHYQEFLEWLDTPAGRDTANRFIRIAWGVWKRGKRIGAKAIWERLRWNHELRRNDNDAAYKLNNNYTAYMARLAMEKEDRLQGFFSVREIRDIPDTSTRRALVVLLKQNRGVQTQ